MSSQSRPGPQGAEYKGEQAYDNVVEEVISEARRKHGPIEGFEDAKQAIPLAAESFVASQTDNRPAYRFISACLAWSDRGPHPPTWKQHKWDADRPDGAMKCAAASCLASDALARIEL